MKNLIGFLMLFICAPLIGIGIAELHEKLFGKEKANIWWRQLLFFVPFLILIIGILFCIFSL